MASKQSNIIAGEFRESFGDFAIYEAEGRQLPYAVWWKGEQLFCFFAGYEAAVEYAKGKAAGRKRL